MTSFTISASGTREEVLNSLENQRDPGEHAHSSLKNQLLDHIEGYIEETPEGSAGFSVSASCSISYGVPAQAAETQQEPEL